MTAAQWLKEMTFPAEDQDLASSAVVYIKKGAGRSLKAGGQWIYDNEIDRMEAGEAEGPETKAAGATGEAGSGSAHNKPGEDCMAGVRLEGNVPDGAILRVRDFDGYPLGYGFINTHSKIRIRMLTRYQTETITPALIRRRVRDAWEYRKAVMGSDVSSCRVIFGEADFLPGITIDKFEDVLVIESLALGTDRLKLLILRYLTQALEEDGILIRGIYERSDAKVRKLEGMELHKGFIGPEFDTLVPITENGIRYIVDVKDGQKTGFFLDQKYNRAAVARIVRNMQEAPGPGSMTQGAAEQAPGSNPGGLRVLDCFTHTGSFGLNCAMAGAADVLSVDASELALQQAAENAKRNGYVKDIAPAETPEGITGGTKAEGFTITLENPATGRHITYKTADVFELLPALEEAGGHYDIVILDPPAFTKSRQATKNAIKGYREINIRGMRLVRDGGILATCSCSHFMEEDLFRKTLHEAARSARVRLRQIEFRTQAPDHPILWGDSESYYLKFVIFQVTREV